MQNQGFYKSLLEGKCVDKTIWATSGIAERSIEPERLNVQLQERGEKYGKEEEKVEKKAEPLGRLKAEEKDEQVEQKEPLVRLVRYDSSIPNALDSILPRYIYTFKIHPFSQHMYIQSPTKVWSLSE